jgi:chromosome segregation ATPase
MKTTAREDLTAVIRQNSVRRTLTDLAAEGKAHVRVVSSQKVIELIEAIVDDAIRREAGEMARQDRDRIVDESRGEFRKVLAIQAKQDEQVRKSREEAEEQRKRSDDLTARLTAERENRMTSEEQLRVESRESLGRVEGKLRQVETELERAREAAETAISRAIDEAKKRARAEGQIQKEQVWVAQVTRDRDDFEERLRSLRKDMEERLREAASRLTAQTEEIASLRSGNASLEGELKARTKGIQRLESMLVEHKRNGTNGKHRSDPLQAKELRDALDRVGELEPQLEEARRTSLKERKRGERLARGFRKAMAKGASSRATFGQQQADRFNGEIAEVKALMRRLVEQPNDGTDRAALDDLVAKLTARDHQLEGRFSEQLDQTLSEINRALRVATMGAVDVDGEATDILVDRIFDLESEMKTNLGFLAVEERASGNGIEGSLARLRKARVQSANDAGD